MAVQPPLPCECGSFCTVIKYIKTCNIYHISPRYKRAQNPQFVLFRTCKVHPRVLVKVCHDTKTLLSTEFVVYISANHDLDFINSLSMAESRVNRKLLTLKVGDHFSCLHPMGTLHQGSPRQQGPSPSAEGGAEEGTSAGRVSAGV